MTNAQLTRASYPGLVPRERTRTATIKLQEGSIDMANTVGFTFALLALVSAVVAGQHQRLFETRLSIDDQAGSNGAPKRTTGYFDVRTDRIPAHTSCPALSLPPYTPVPCTESAVRVGQQRADVFLVF